MTIPQLNRKFYEVVRLQLILIYDIKVILSRLVAKAEQLIDNVMTNPGCMYDVNSTGERSLTDLRVGRGNIVVWGLAYRTTSLSGGDPHFGNKWPALPQVKFLQT